MTTSVTVSVKCGADSRYQCCGGLLPCVFRVEGRVVHYTAMAVEQKIYFNTAWHCIPKEQFSSSSLSLLLLGVMLSNCVHASTQAHAYTYTRNMSQ
jgi:hypothetical protein